MRKDGKEEGRGEERKEEKKIKKKNLPKELGSGTRKFHFSAFPKRDGQGPMAI